MNRITKMTTCLVFGLLVTCGDMLGRSAQADDGARIFRDAAGFTTYDQTVTEASSAGHRNVPFGTRWRVFNQIGDGIGYDDGHTFISAFAPIHINPWVDLVFLDGRVAVNYGGVGDLVTLNGGVGYRRYVDGWKTMFGGSLWIDYDAGHQESVTQVGASGEIVMMDSGLELRANGYLAADRDQTQNIVRGAVTDPYFLGNQIRFDQIFITQHQYHGFDAEMGGPVPYLGRHGINGYIGGYWLGTDNFDDTAGLKTRWEAFIHKDIQIGMEIRHDEEFGTSSWGNVMFQLPNSWHGWWRGKNWIRERNLAEHLSRQVERTYRVPTKQQTVATPNVFINPADGEPIYVMHVNAGGAGGGDGTFENPFNSQNFANNPNADIIRVEGGGTLALNGPLTLFDNQRLLGSTVPHAFQSTIGTFQLPGQTTGAPTTLLNNLGGDVVVLADNNEVSGLSFDGSGTGAGIVGTDIAGFNLNRLTIGNATDGIRLTNAVPGVNGIGVIDDVDVTGSQNGIRLVADLGGSTWANIRNSNTSGNTQNGVLLESTGAGSVMNVAVDNHVSEFNGETGMTAGVGGTSSLDLLVTNSFFGFNADDGLLLTRSDQSQLGLGSGVHIGALDNGNTFFGNGGDGFRVLSSGSDDHANFVNVTDNEFLLNEGSGMGIDLTAESVVLFNNQLNLYAFNQTHGLRIATSQNASIGNQFTFNGMDALASASVFDGETIIGNGVDGINITTPGPNNQSWQNIAVTGVVARTSILSNENNGITIVNTAVPTVNGLNPTENYFTVRGTDIIDSGNDGMNIALLGGESDLFPEHTTTRSGTNVVTIGGPAAGQDVLISQSGGEGVEVNVEHQDVGIFGGVPTIDFVPGTDTFNIDSLTSSDNVSDGFEITTTGASDVNFNMVRSAMLNNGGVGLEIVVSSVNAPFSPANTESIYNIGTDVAGTGNLFQGNTLQGVYFQTSSPVPAGGNADTFPIIANTFLSDDSGSPPLQEPQFNLNSGFYADQRNVNDFTFTTARLNFFGNTVRDNGTAGNDADGLVLAVGTNTHQFAAISGNTFGGNQGADINIVTIASQNPGSSITNFIGTTDLIYADPIGQLDLALGLNFPAPNPPVSGEIPNGSLPNNAFELTVTTAGITTPLAGRTETGVFTNTDVASGVTIKPANRAAFSVFRVYDANPSVIDDNVFLATGPASATFANANRNIGGGGNPPGGPIPNFDTIQLQPLGAVFP